MPPARKHKHEAPDASAALFRERLFDQLGRDGRLTWVYGPAGSGKTTLVASYLVAAPTRTALWYRCDARDVDPATFFGGLSELAQDALHPETPLPRMDAGDLAALRYFTRTFLERLYAELPAHAVVVLDDAHEVQGDPIWESLLPLLVAALPRRVALIIASREPPPPSLARLDVHGELDTVTPGDLGFTRDEIAALAGAPPDSPIVASVHERTRGWAAGVRVLLQKVARGASLDPHADASLNDYLRRELLATLDAEDRALLVATSPLSVIDPDIARALAGDDDAAARLERLAQAGAFVERIGSSAASFRVHALLRDLLLVERRSLRPAPELTAEAERASALLAAAGQLAHAVDVSLEFGTGALGARELPALGAGLLAQGRARELLGLIDRIDPARAHADARLAHLWGRALATLYAPGSTGALERALRLYLDAGDGAATVEAYCDWVMAASMQLLDVAPIDRALAMADEIGALLTPDADPRLSFRYDVALTTALHFRATGDPRLEDLAARIVATAEAQGAPARAEAACLVATYHIMGGRPADAEHALRRLVVADLPLPPVTRALVRYARVYLAWVKGDPAAFEHERASWHAVIDEAELAAMHPLRVIIDAIDHLCRGAPGAAPSALLEPLAASQHLPPLMEVFVAVLRTWSALAQGQHVQARARHAVAERLNAGVELAGNSLLIRLAGALLDAADGHLAAALADVRAARRELGTLRLHLHEAAARYLEAWLRLQAGDRQGLRDAFSFARERGIVNVWLVPQGHLATLCAEALTDGVEPRFVAHLIAVRALPAPAPLAALARWPARLRVRCLGPLEVVRDDRPLPLSRRAPQRPLELLVAIVAFGGRAVPIPRLADALWPDLEGDAAHRAFKVALHRLRALLGVEDAIVVTQQTVSLDPSLVWVDVDAAEHLAHAHAQGLSADLARARLGDIDRGPLAPSLGDAPWLLEPRRHLSQLVARLSAAVSQR